MGRPVVIHLGRIYRNGIMKITLNFSNRELVNHRRAESGTRNRIGFRWRFQANGTGLTSFQWPDDWFAATQPIVTNLFGLKRQGTPLGDLIMELSFPSGTALDSWLTTNATWTLRIDDEEIIVNDIEHRATFGYSNGFYNITFPNISQPRMKVILDEWNTTSSVEPFSLVIDDLATVDQVHGHALVRIPAFGSQPARDLWTGEGDLVVDGVTYTGTTINGESLMSVTPVEQTVESPNVRCSLRIGLNTEFIRRLWLDDPGPLLCKVGWIVSKNAGRTWETLAVRFNGYLSDNGYSDGILATELETWSGDVARVGLGVRMYSHESQQARYPGDRFFEYQRSLAAGHERREPP